MSSILTVTAHEVGHTFGFGSGLDLTLTDSSPGSPHDCGDDATCAALDGTECVPAGNRFIMYYSLTSGSSLCLICSQCSWATQAPTRSCSPHAQRQEFKSLLRFSLVCLRFIMMRAQAQGSCFVQANPCAFGGICCDGLNLRPAGVLCRPTPSDLPCLAPATCDGLADYCFPFLDRTHMSGMSSFCPDHVPLSGLACALNASFPASINGVCSASGGSRLP